MWWWCRLCGIAFACVVVVSFVWHHKFLCMASSIAHSSPLPCMASHTLCITGQSHKIVLKFQVWRRDLRLEYKRKHITSSTSLIYPNLYPNRTRRILKRSDGLSEKVCPYPPHMEIVKTLCKLLNYNYLRGLFYSAQMFTINHIILWLLLGRLSDKRPF